MKIIFLVPYPVDVAPSQRFRVEAYFSILAEQGIKFDVQPFLDIETWQVLYRERNSLRKTFGLLKGFARRLSILFKISSYDFVFVHRECAPIGPPVFEFIIAKILRKKLIFDFDDAIWLPDRPNESFITRMLKWRSKIASVCRWSYRISAGNQYLAGFALKHNTHVTVNPTVVDTTSHHNPDLFVKDQKPNVTICWTGSNSTIKHLGEIESVIKALLKKHQHVQFVAVADREPVLDFPIKFVMWSKETEVSTLSASDIGIMPLPDNEWTRGKCGFKAIQYMAMSLPAVASGVGVNNTIITHGENGFVASTAADWFYYLEKLIVDAALRKAMGSKAREHIVRHYSIESNRATFLSLFDRSEYS